MTSRIECWNRLIAAGLAQGDMPPASEGRAPWYVRSMQAIAGWLAAVFLLGFFGMAFALLFKNPGAALVAGLALCAGAVVFFRAAPRSDFVAQFGLAASLSGQVLVVFGLTELVAKSVNAAAVTVMLMETALFILMRHYLHRVLSAAAAVLALLWLVVDAGGYPLVPAIVTAGVAAAWLPEFRYARQGSLLRAGGYGVALAALCAVVSHGALWVLWLTSIGRRANLPGPAMEWAGHAVLAVVLGVVAWKLLEREGLDARSPQDRVACVGVVILALASIKAPGLAPTLTILLMGFANGNRLLAGIGLVTLLGYLSHYYYSLQLTLLEKSGVLAATGIALLVVRAAMAQWWPAQDSRETAHA